MKLRRALRDTPASLAMAAFEAAPGARVAAGQGLAAVGAMKMENGVAVPADGAAAAVRPAQGAPLEARRGPVIPTAEGGA